MLVLSSVSPLSFLLSVLDSSASLCLRLSMSICALSRIPLSALLCFFLSILLRFSHLFLSPLSIFPASLFLSFFHLPSLPPLFLSVFVFVTPTWSLCVSFSLLSAPCFPFNLLPPALTIYIYISVWLTRAEQQWPRPHATAVSDSFLRHRVVASVRRGKGSRLVHAQTAHSPRKPRAETPSRSRDPLPLSPSQRGAEGGGDPQGPLRGPLVLEN